MSKTRNYSDMGFLIMRIGIGLMFVSHGYPKITGGSELWMGLGEKAMSPLGVGFGFTFFGFMAAFSEFFGGIMFAAGLAARAASGLIFITMFVASNLHLTSGDGLTAASHAIESAILFFSMIFIGAGKYSCDYLICKKRKDRPAVFAAEDING